MSYARFGAGGSDVYVFYNTDFFYECCGCILEDATTPTWCKDAAEMLEHLQEHQDAGHTVPQWTIDAIAAEADEVSE